MRIDRRLKVLSVLTLLSVGAALLFSPSAHAARDISRLCPASLATEQRFGDVAPGSVHAQGINCLARATITTGLAGGTTYGPDQPVSRGQMATFLRRLVDGTTKPVPPLGDVPADVRGHTHAPAVGALLAAGIIPSSQPFRPDSPIRRDEMADWMNGTWRWLTGAEVSATGQPFADMAGNPHAADVAGLYVHGVINGKDSGYDPAGSVTRAQMGSFLARLMNMHADAGHFAAFPPVPTTTVPPTTVTTAAPTAPGDAVSADALFAHHNAQRAARGLPALARNACLDQVAAVWAQHLAAQHALAHRTPGDQAAHSAACLPGRTAWSENVGYHGSVAEMAATFMASPTHRGNILAPDVSQAGVGAWRDGDGHIWFTVNFAG